MSNQRIVGLAVAGTVAAGAIGALVWTHRDAESSFESSPSHVAISHEIDDADTPKELFEHADAVVVGQVTGSEVGRTFGDRVAEQMTDRLITVKVSEVLKSPAPSIGLATGDEIKVVEGYWNGNKDGFVLDNVTWSNPAPTVSTF